MASTAAGPPRKVKDMVAFFEKQADHHPVTTTRGRRRKSVEAMLSLTKRPWEHFPRRKSSTSTDHRRRSSASTRSNSTTCDPAEVYISEPSYAASERSGTSTVVSEDRRPSENPDYDWEHDSIADLKAGFKKLDLSPATSGSFLKGGETADEIHVVDPSGIEESKRLSNGVPGVHEIDFVDPSAPRTAEAEPRSEPTWENVPALIEPEDHAEASNSDSSRAVVTDEDELASPYAAVAESRAWEAADSSQQFVEAKIQPPPRTSSTNEKGPGKAGLLHVKTSSHPENDHNKITIDTKSPGSPKSPRSPNTPSPKSKARPKLAVDLPGIPESEAETLGRQHHHMQRMHHPHRRPSLSIIQPLRPGGQGQQHTTQAVVHVNRASRPPVSMNSRYPTRSISAPLPSQPEPVPAAEVYSAPREVSTAPREVCGAPMEMMQLVSQRQVKFNDMREEKMRRLSGASSGGAAGPSSRQGSLSMGRRQASVFVSPPVPGSGAGGTSSRKRQKQQRRRSGPARPSFAQRMSVSASTGGGGSHGRSPIGQQRRQGLSQAIKEHFRAPGRRPSWLMGRGRSQTT